LTENRLITRDNQNLLTLRDIEKRRSVYTDGAVAEGDLPILQAGLFILIPRLLGLKKYFLPAEA